MTASFEDIATILGDKLESDDGAAAALGSATAAAPTRSVDNLRDLASGAPVVRAVNDLIEKAVELRASDIHIEPFRNGLTVRMRVDGLLRAVPAPPTCCRKRSSRASRILAGLNIAERRLPAGRRGATAGGAGRSRHPRRHHADAVRRIRGHPPIAARSRPARHSQIGPRAERRKKGAAPSRSAAWDDRGHRPTGSGKTTTLATMLSVLNSPSRKILTIEDPVEYEIPGINQSQVKPAIGLTFAAAMRAFVRQDPDVIMVGEVRDAETASIAVHAALTGHLVLTTLHTETSTAAVPRLIDLGVEAFLLKSTLRAVIAQRLVRLLCDRCKTERKLTEADFDADPRLATLGFKSRRTRSSSPKGCERCGGVGYRGRVGVFEVLDVTGEVRDLIGPNAASGALDDAAMKAGMTTMIDDAVGKCRSGTTSFAEALRVTTIR